MARDINKLAIAEARRQLERSGAADYTAEELAEAALDILADWARESARERLEDGYDDAPTVANCDDAGTGEGRFHGRI